MDWVFGNIFVGYNNRSAMKNRNPNIMLRVESINTFYGSAQILFDLTLEVKRGEVVVLLGRNGAGKTTTFKSIMGFVALKKGAVYAMRVDGYNCQGDGKWFTCGLGSKHIDYEDIVKDTYQLLLDLVTSEDGHFDLHNNTYDKFTKIVEKNTTNLV